jgi:hypothetical protein
MERKKCFCLCGCAFTPAALLPPQHRLRIRQRSTGNDGGKGRRTGVGDIFVFILEHAEITHGFLHTVTAKPRSCDIALFRCLWSKGSASRLLVSVTSWEESLVRPSLWLISSTGTVYVPSPFPRISVSPEVARL